GYAGGSIIMTCRHLEVGSKFVCKGKPSSQCEIMVHTQTQKSNKWVQQNRLYLYEESRKEFTVLYRNLSSQDAGSYQCGETGVWSNEMNLIVNSGDMNVTFPSKLLEIHIVLIPKINTFSNTRNLEISTKELSTLAVTLVKLLTLTLILMYNYGCFHLI
uniref:Immunoglobulin V-set domain-containing protein n=1 Tax=Pygocentrus nattereri TaxID=42514 RepID=A0A3B4C8X6_PYGNA